MNTVTDALTATIGADAVSAPAVSRPRERATAAEVRHRPRCPLPRHARSRLGRRRSRGWRPARTRVSSSSRSGACWASRWWRSSCSSRCGAGSRRRCRPASARFPARRGVGGGPAALWPTTWPSAPRPRRSTSGRSSATPSGWRRIPDASVKIAQVHRQADLHRPDPHQPEDGVHRLPDRDAGRRADRHPVRPVADDQRGAQSVDPDLQAGLAARLAADRHDGGQRASTPAPIRCSRSPSSTRRSP